jgi:hypothetical protein
MVYSWLNATTGNNAEISMQIYLLIIYYTCLVWVWEGKTTSKIGGKDEKV